MGLAIDQPRSTHLERVSRTITRKKLNYSKMLAGIVETARQQGVRFGGLQIIDSVHE